MTEVHESLPGAHLSGPGSNRVRARDVERLAHRQEIRVCVLRAEKYDDGFPQMPGLIEFAAWLNGIIEEIPAEHRDKARIEIESASGYEGSHYPSIEITYVRPETDEEWEKRKANLLQYIDQQNAQERATYEALKEKYG